MFKWLSLNNFCIYFLIFSALELLTSLDIAILSSLLNQYLFYYNFLKVDKEENYQRLHKALKNSVFGHFSYSITPKKVEKEQLPEGGLQKAVYLPLTPFSK